MSKRAYGKCLFLLLILGLSIHDIWSFSAAFNFHQAVSVIVVLQIGWWIAIMVTIMFILLLAALIKQDRSLL